MNNLRLVMALVLNMQSAEMLKYRGDAVDVQCITVLKVFVT